MTKRSLTWEGIAPKRSLTWDALVAKPQGGRTIIRDV